MAFIEWTNNYKTGILSVDTQHKTLFDAVNNLHDAMKSGKGKDVISQTVNFLIDYTVTHFQSEEKLMSDYNYSGYLKQKKEHDGFINKIKETKDKLDSGSLGLSVEVLNFLSSWLKDHIMKEDFAYIPFFKEKGLIK